MCGIAGFLDFKSEFKKHQLEEVTTSMAQTLKHRGPNDQGVWTDERLGIALGHQRLSVIDLSQSGHQPMQSYCGRYTVAYNGEIYNFKELRKELENLGHVLRGNSDTEVLLASISEWGLKSAIQKFVGMFAFAIWDHEEATLWLARDRMGEKPLYYGWAGHFFLFGSELKALKRHPAFKPEIDSSALELYFRYTSIPAPHSIYQGVYKVMPGTLMGIRRRAVVGEEPYQETYWSLEEVAEQGMLNAKKDVSEEEILKEFEGKLKETVKGQMLADVPLGAFLSGGIDSSLIVALMQSQSSKPVRTFTVGFEDQHLNEAVYAKKIAAHLKTEHTELYVSPKEALNVIPKLPELYDEPFADASQIPTHLISSLTRKHVTVSLSGDGGDELLGGYQRYLWTFWMWNKIKGIPHPLRKLWVRTGGAGFECLLRLVYPAFHPFLSEKTQRFNFTQKVKKWNLAFDAKDPEAIYEKIITHWTNSSKLIKGLDANYGSIYTQRHRWLNGASSLDQILYLDQKFHLSDTILAKVDRASMGVSLETRIPFLDHRLVELFWKVPARFKIEKDSGKQLFRKLLKQYVPEDLFNRPKAGFDVPIEHWLRGDLRDWAEALLEPKRLKEEGYLDASLVRKAWSDHLLGRESTHYRLWCVLMFQSWLEKNNGND